MTGFNYKDVFLFYAWAAFVWFYRHRSLWWALVTLDRQKRSRETLRSWRRWGRRSTPRNALGTYNEETGKNKLVVLYIFHLYCIFIFRFKAFVWTVFQTLSLWWFLRCSGPQSNRGQRCDLSPKPEQREFRPSSTFLQHLKTKIPIGRVVRAAVHVSFFFML